jgi:UDP-GlcNAc3NAcA epimerase
MRRILSVVGARPQFIKASLITKRLRELPGIEEILVHTGQHYDANMSDLFFSKLDLPAPDRYLGVGSSSHGRQTARMLEGLEEVFLELHPDLVLVYGDTNTTLAGALAAVKLHIPIAHIEAGLRSKNRRMPEEINRVLTDHISELLFAPTEVAVRNLLSEGIPSSLIHLVGDVMYDVCLYFRSLLQGRKDLFHQLQIPEKDYILVTIHRAENTDDVERFTNIFSALAIVAQSYPIIFPVHPRTRKLMNTLGVKIPENLYLLDPVGYLEMQILESCAILIATDSGGVQKEAYFHRIPCATLRDETEWVELIETGWNRLVSPNLPPDRIVDEILNAIGKKGKDKDLYGGGMAGERIVTILSKFLGQGG